MGLEINCSPYTLGGDPSSWLADRYSLGGGDVDYAQGRGFLKLGAFAANAALFKKTESTFHDMDVHVSVYTVMVQVLTTLS